jgi:predicted regulator of Ras-like GTPase activity (Roadblock/LC7/MglB family)
MFSTFRKLFGMRAETVADSRGQFHQVAPAPAPRATPARTARTGLQPRPAGQAAPATGALRIPLHAVLSRLPAELMQHVRQMDVGEAEVSVPMQKILSQINHGAVKMTFAELRQCAPPGIFTPDTSRDRTLVDIPLNEILSRLDPALLPRRAVQKQVLVPAEITGPCNGQSQVVFSTTSLKPATQTSLTSRAQVAAAAAEPPAPSAPAVSRAPAPPLAPPVQSPQPVNRIQSGAPLFTRAQPAPAVSPMAPPKPALPPQPIAPVRSVPAAQASAPFWAAPAAAPAVETPEPVFGKANPIAPPPPVTPVAPEPVSAPEAPFASAPIAMPGSPRYAAPSAPITPIAPEPQAEPEPIRFQVPPAEPVAPAPIPVETRFLTVALADLFMSWPEAVQHEIVAHHMAKLSVALPFGVIELALKQGKVALPWRIIRSWIKPAPAPSSSPNDAVVLELPLKIVTPLFLAEMRTARTQKKITIDENIPDLFSGRPQPEAPARVPAAVVPPPAPPVSAHAPSAAKAADTNYFGKGALEGHPEEAAPVVKKGPSPGTAFLVRYATPNEIVSKAAALEGVDGALIALPDGLLVASHIPVSMNADTIAAFLPQIFSRVTQCTKELRLGELNNLNFTVGAVPWKIFKVGAIYFAAFGRPGEPLPSAQLAGIAAELDRKAK